MTRDLTKQDYAVVLLAEAACAQTTLVASIELVAIELHGKISPTDWIHLTTEQRNSTRRRSMGLVNEALEFWDNEVRKAKQNE